ncbi:hypothetical protein O181_027676 [Austropuccinia psidii MF-1]|uniref:Uncharacterized protein n=1 Tax=Austropuccinia psidii MF-1 TaxID=1389203 RepID=A0A9Q3H1N7_9BASI|nr:hypothetical protein [Austropuccinia psidii MF-1]
MTFSLNPGCSLGQFELGSLLWNVINIIRSEQSAFPNVHLSWDSQKAATGFVLLSIPSPPLHMLFDGASQRLLVIEAYQPPAHESVASVCPPPIGQWIVYKSQPIAQAVGANEPGVNLRVIHRLFGPTYPPAPHVAHPDEQVVSYPGVAFSFFEKLLVRVILSLQPTGNQDDREIIPLGETYFKPKIPKFLDCMDGDVKCAQIILGRLGQEPTSIHFSFHSASSSQLPPAVIVTIGRSTSEDVMCDFGAPLRTFWKEDDRMKIHAHLGTVGTQNGQSEEPNPYFMSYFNLGVDFLIDPLSNRVLKVIMHSNIPGEVLFARYSRCPWEICTTHDQSPLGTNTGKATLLIQRLKTNPCEENSDPSEVPTAGDSSSPHDPPPSESSSSGQPFNNQNEDASAAETLVKMMEPVMLLDRTADILDEGLLLQKPTRLYGLPGIAFEVTQDDDIETIWLF